MRRTIPNTSCGVPPLPSPVVGAAGSPEQHEGEKKENNPRERRTVDSHGGAGRPDNAWTIGTLVIARAGREEQRSTPRSPQGPSRRRRRATRARTH